MPQNDAELEPLVGDEPVHHVGLALVVFVGHLGDQLGCTEEELDGGELGLRCSTAWLGCRGVGVGCSGLGHGWFLLAAGGEQQDVKAKRLGKRQTPNAFSK